LAWLVFSMFLDPTCELSERTIVPQFTLTPKRKQTKEMKTKKIYIIIIIIIFIEAVLSTTISNAFTMNYSKKNTCY